LELCFWCLEIVEGGWFVLGELGVGGGGYVEGAGRRRSSGT